MRQIPRPPVLSASQHPAHFANKSLDKPAPTKEGPPPPVTTAVIAKQNEYLRQWNALEPTIADLPAEDQRARRAALKRQVMGE
jgi:hypothetical protein